MMKSGKAMPVPAGVALGVGISLLTTLVGAIILTWMVASQKIAQDSIGYGCMIILPAAAALGSVCGCNAVKHRRLLVCGLCSLCFFLVLFVIALLFGGQFKAVGVSAIMIGLGGGISTIPTITGNRSGARRRKFSHYR